MKSWGIIARVGFGVFTHSGPSAAIPASMPGCPLRNACVRPSWLTGRRDQRPPRGGLTADLALPVVHPSDLFQQDLWEQSLLARRPYSRPGSPAIPPIQLWERACSRRRQLSRYQCCLTLRYREQARSHSCFELTVVSATTQLPSVGASLLAMASAQSASIRTLPLGPRRRHLLGFQMIQRPLNQ